MPGPEAATSTDPPLFCAATVIEVVALIESYAAADRELADEMDRIDAEVWSSHRVSQATVTRLLRLLETSLMPGIRAKAELEALPTSLRRAGVAAWVRQGRLAAPGGAAP